MKLIHLADLHIGKRVGEFWLVEDQRYILNKILSVVKDESPAAVLIAGDVYDKNQPSAEAVNILNWFITELTDISEAVFVISGNHDSPERLSFGNKLLSRSGVHISGIFQGSVEKRVLKDSHGPVNIYMLPFLKPAVVKPHYDTEIESYDDAVKTIVDSLEVDVNERNVLLSHQFVTGGGGAQPERSDSESISVGGLDNVYGSSFEPFDYVALGHLHIPQSVVRQTIRYAGSPLKYSFSEALQQKSVTVVELGEKGSVDVRLVPIMPLRDMRKLKGPIDELIATAELDKSGAEDYIHVTLTDDGEVFDAIGKLRAVYPNVMSL